MESPLGRSAAPAAQEPKKRQRQPRTKKVPYRMHREVVKALGLQRSAIGQAEELSSAEARAECNRRKGSGDARLRLKGETLALGVWGGAKGTVEQLVERIKIADAGVKASIRACELIRSFVDANDGNGLSSSDVKDIVEAMCDFDVSTVLDGVDDGVDPGVDPKYISVQMSSIDIEQKSVSDDVGWQELRDAAELGVQLLAIADVVQNDGKQRRGQWMRAQLAKKQGVCSETCVVTNVLDTVLRLAKANGRRFTFSEFVCALPFVEPVVAPNPPAASATSSAATTASAGKEKSITLTEHEACRIAHVMADVGMSACIGTLYHGRTLQQIDDKSQRDAAKKKITEFYNDSANQFPHPDGTDGVTPEDFASIDTNAFRQLTVTQVFSGWGTVASAHSVFERRWLLLSGHKNPDVSVIPEANQVAVKMRCKPVQAAYLHALFFTDGVPHSGLWEQLSRNLPANAALESQADSEGEVRCSGWDSRATCQCPKCVERRRRAGSSGGGEIANAMRALAPSKALVQDQRQNNQAQTEYFNAEANALRASSRVAMVKELHAAKASYRAAKARADLSGATEEDKEVCADALELVTVLENERDRLAPEPKRQR
eukprot:COSAG01_NODE_9248_length_2504_cov_13.146778_1_plen_602_part_01